MNPSTATRERARGLLTRLAYFLYQRRHTELCGGNVSLRFGDEVAMTPTKASEHYGWRLGVEDTLVLGLDGEVRAGDPALLSRETEFHLRVYRRLPDIGSVFHLHLVHAIATASTDRWQEGVIDKTPERFGTALCLLESHYDGQTEEHDARIEELMACVSRERGVVVMAPGHGVFSAAPDSVSNIRAVEVFRHRLRVAHLRGRIAAIGGTQ